MNIDQALIDVTTMPYCDALDIFVNFGYGKQRNIFKKGGLDMISSQRQNVRAIHIILIMLLILNNLYAYADGKSEYSGEYSFYSEIRSSYAWNEKFLFMAEMNKNILSDHTCFAGAPYALSRVDRASGEKKVLIEEFPYCEIRLISNSNSILVFAQNEDEEFCKVPLKYYMESNSQSEETYLNGERIRGGFCLIELDFDGIEKSRYQTELGESIQDYIFYQDNLYIATGHTIFCLNINTNSLNRIYECQTKIRNRVGNGMQIEDGRLYIQDGQQIIAVSTYNYTYESVCEFNNSTYWGAAYASHDYLVQGGLLYYWDDVIKCTVCIDINSGEQEIISMDSYIVVQKAEDGIMFKRIPKEQIQSLYDKAEYEKGKYTIKLHGDYERKLLIFSKSEDGGKKLKWDSAMTLGSKKYVYLGAGQYLLIEGGRSAGKIIYNLMESATIGECESAFQE